MSVRYQKKHVRRTHAEEFVEWVTVGEDGLSVEVDVPDWSSPRTFDFHFLVPCLATSLAQAVAHAFGQPDGSRRVGHAPQPVLPRHALREGGLLHTV